MSTNCIQCIVKKRTGPDLLCDECRIHTGSCLICGELRLFATWSGSAGVCLECREAAHHRTTPPTQSKPCNYCEGTGSVETAPCVSVVCPICKGERYCTTPPTQSQEGETLELAERIANLTDEQRRIVNDNLLGKSTWLIVDSLERSSGYIAAQRENDRLRKLIEDAPHGLDCQRERKYDGNADKFIDVGCTCWKSRAATEEGKRG